MRPWLRDLFLWHYSLAIQIQQGKQYNLPLNTQSSWELIVLKINARRQITLPAHQCRLAGIEPGDECRSFAADGRITIIRQQSGAAWGCLAHLRADGMVSEEQSLQDVIERKRE